MQNRDQLRAVACRLAELGVRTARRFFGKAATSRKADGTPVTDADHAAQAAILDTLARERPADAAITEEVIVRPERHVAAGAAEYCWVIDPIDGTRNFGRGLDLWCTSVAVLQAGRPIAGAICDSAGHLYSAIVGDGVYVDGRPGTHLVERPLDADTTIAVSSPRRSGLSPVVRGWMDRYLYRNVGSLCLHLAWVATGLTDAVYASECKLWDIAAGGLLIEMAGGVVTNHAGRPIWPLDAGDYHGEDLPILAASPAMHARLLSDLRAK